MDRKNVPNLQLMLRDGAMEVVQLDYGGFVDAKRFES